MVGRDVLLGAACAVLFTFAPKLSVLMHIRPPDAGELGVFLSPMSWTSDRAYLASLLQHLAGAFTTPVTLVLVLLVLRVIVRRTWLTYHDGAVRRHRDLRRLRVDRESEGLQGIGAGSLEESQDCGNDPIEGATLTGCHPSSGFCRSPSFRF